MPIVTDCTWPGCKTLTIGLFCVEHEVPTERSFVRGRGWPLPALITSSELAAKRVSEYSRHELRRASAPLAGARALR
jgi:hypothetical protein